MKALAHRASSALRDDADHRPTEARLARLEHETVDPLFRNTWSWGGDATRPMLRQAATGTTAVIAASHPDLGRAQRLRVAVPYRGYWFWIDDRDMASKRMFTFLMFIFTLVETGGKEAPRPHDPDEVRWRLMWARRSISGSTSRHPGRAPLGLTIHETPTTRARSGEGIGNVEEVELPEVPIDRVQSADPVLPEEGRKMGVGNEVAADGEVVGDGAIDVEKSLSLREDANTRQTEQGLDVAEGLGRRQRTSEDSGMSGDPQKGHGRGPRDAEEVRVLGALLEEGEGCRVLGAGCVRRVEEDVDVDRVAHASWRSRTP
jgi:hypothetical protein